MSISGIIRLFATGIHGVVGLQFLTRGSFPVLSGSDSPDCPSHADAGRSWNHQSPVQNSICASPTHSTDCASDENRSNRPFREPDRIWKSLRHMIDFSDRMRLTQ